MGANTWIFAIVSDVRSLRACRHSLLPHWSHVSVPSHPCGYVKLHSLFSGKPSGIHRTGSNDFATVISTFSLVWALTWEYPRRDGDPVHSSKASRISCPSICSLCRRIPVPSRTSRGSLWERRIPGPFTRGNTIVDRILCNTLLTESIQVKLLKRNRAGALQ